MFEVEFVFRREETAKQSLRRRARWLELRKASGTKDLPHSGKSEADQMELR